MDLIESNDRLRAFLTPHEKLLCSRLGVVESRVLDAVDAENSRIPLSLRKQAWVNAGVFPPIKPQLRSFAGNYREAITNSDLLAVWPSEIQAAHDNLITRYGSDKPQVAMSVLDVFSCANLIETEEIWISRLGGKKVLVVHPFARSFQKQYSNFSKLHKVPLIPAFDAAFTSPPMTQGISIFGGTYNSNLGAYLEVLHNITCEEKFDYALVAAGAYGLPIASFLKERAITSIYVGGALQLYFGVAGGRWKNRPDLQKYKTPFWLETPLESPPGGANLIEGKTYW